MGNHLFQMQITIRIFPYLLSMIFITIRDIIPKSKILRLGTCKSSLCGTFIFTGYKSLYFTVRLILDMIPVTFVISKKNQMSGFWLHRNRGKGEGHLANYLLILWETSTKLHNKYEGPNFYLGHPLYSQYKAQVELLVSCPNVSVRVWAGTDWLNVIGLTYLLSLSFFISEFECKILLQRKRLSITFTHVQV
jgi:hypothetical protein